MLILRLYQYHNNCEWKWITSFQTKHEKIKVRKRFLFWEYDSVKYNFLETEEQMLKRCIEEAQRLYGNELPLKLVDYVITDLGDMARTMWKNYAITKTIIGSNDQLVDQPDC